MWQTCRNKKHSIKPFLEQYGVYDYEGGGEYKEMANKVSISKELQAKIDKAAEDLIHELEISEKYNDGPQAFWLIQ